MQGNPTYYPSAHAPATRTMWITLVILVAFLLLGIAVGFFAAKGATRDATLNVRLENRTDATQDFAVFLNGAQVATTPLAPGQTATFEFRVEWSGTTNGMYEVRAVGAFGGNDDERVTVSDGQTLLVHLRVG